MIFSNINLLFIFLNPSIQKEFFKGFNLQVLFNQHNTFYRRLHIFLWESLLFWVRIN